MPPLPATRTRPRDRRATIQAVAMELFAARGYQSVSMNDIAQAVGVRAAALYRHFPGKQELLDGIIAAAVQGLEANLRSLGRVPDESANLLELAGYALDNRDAVTLVTREILNVSAPARGELDAAVLGLGQIVASQIVEARPTLRAGQADLLSWTAGAVLQTPAFHPPRLAREEYCGELARLFGQVRAAELPAGFTGRRRAGGHPGLAPVWRAEAILASAVLLFSEEGYASVSMEQIGTALGMAGPSVYNHFRNKAEILVTALTRTSSHLSMVMADALASTSDPAHALRSLVSSYAEFAVAHPAHLTLLVTEQRSLPEPERSRVAEAGKAFVAELSSLLRQSDPEVSAGIAQLRVHVVLTVVGTIARAAHFRDSEGIGPALSALCLHLLGAEVAAAAA